MFVVLHGFSVFLAAFVFKASPLVILDFLDWVIFFFGGGGLGFLQISLPLFLTRLFVSHVAVGRSAERLILGIVYICQVGMLR